MDMEIYYHKVSFDFSWWDDFNEKECFDFIQDILISHEVLMALIQGGETAQSSWLKSHGGSADRYYDITMYYNLSKKYTREGNLIDSFPDHSPTKNNTTTSNSVTRTNTSYQSSSNSSSKKASQTTSTSGSSDENDMVTIVGGLVMLIVAACIFFFYANEEFGVFWGILYSLFWYITVPVHYFFF